MTLPKSPKDLALAPVATAIDANVSRLRDRRTSAAIDYELQLELNPAPTTPDTRDERVARILRVALRDVDMHGWTATITDDGAAVHLTGGSVSLDVALSAEVQRYIEEAPVAV